jgi:hypothetical protein
MLDNWTLQVYHRSDPVAKLEVVLVVLGTSKHFSKKIIFYCLKKNSPKILKMIHGTLASSIKWKSFQIRLCCSDFKPIRGMIA